MRHSRVTKRRDIQTDAVFNSFLVSKLINNIMHDGKKTVAQNVVYKTFEILAKKDDSTGSPQEDPLTLFEKAIQNVGPKTEIKARRVGGASYQIPIEVRGDRRTALALRWIIEAARAKSNKDFNTFAEKLASEILDASQNQGEAIRKRDNIHRMADANKAFAHYSRN